MTRFGTLNIRCRNIIGIQKETIILTTTHVYLYCSCQDGPLNAATNQIPMQQKEPGPASHEVVCGLFLLAFSREREEQ